MNLPKFLIAVVFALSLLVGCASKLEPGGAYSPGTNIVVNGVTNFVATAAEDKAFFLVDSAFDLAQGTVESVFTSEKNNRLLLWKVSPDIKHTLDKLRPQAWEIEVAYAKARKAYLANRTPAGLDDLNLWLSKLQGLVPAVRAALPTK